MPHIALPAKERACPVCHNRDYVHFADEHIDHTRLNDFAYASRKDPEFMCLRLVRCLHCDLVYAPNPPSGEILHAAYAQASFDSAPEAQAAAQTYARALQPHVARLHCRRAAVDVGAGSGPLLPLLSAQGFAPVVGIEPSRAAINAAPPNVRDMLREGMFGPEVVADLQPSLVCSFMTLEHLSDPGDFVRMAWDLLEPGGMLAVVVHNWRGPLNRLLGRRSPIIDVEHLQLFSPRSVVALLHGAGFDDVTQFPIRNTYSLRYWLRLSPMPARWKQGITRALSRAKLADIPISLSVGNLMAIGTKP
jgi:SAM-dependent methyltransferase